MARTPKIAKLQAQPAEEVRLPRLGDGEHRRVPTDQVTICDCGFDDNFRSLLDFSMDDEKFVALAIDISENGVLMPLHVHPSADGAMLHIDQGHRRFEAAKTMEVLELPVIVGPPIENAVDRDNRLKGDHRNRKDWDSLREILHALATAKNLSQHLKREIKATDPEAVKIHQCKLSDARIADSIRTLPQAVIDLALKDTDEFAEYKKKHPEARKLPDRHYLTPNKLSLVAEVGRLLRKNGGKLSLVKERTDQRLYLDLALRAQQCSVESFARLKSNLMNAGSKPQRLAEVVHQLLGTNEPMNRVNARSETRRYLFDPEFTSRVSDMRRHIKSVMMSLKQMDQQLADEVSLNESMVPEIARLERSANLIPDLNSDLNNLLKVVTEKLKMIKS